MDETIRLRSGKQIAKPNTSTTHKSNAKSSLASSLDSTDRPNKSSNSSNSAKFGAKDSNGQRYTNGCSTGSPAGSSSESSDKESKDISSLVLWRRPLMTLYYASRELMDLSVRLLRWTSSHTRTCLAVALIGLTIAGVSSVEGPHQRLLAVLRSQLLWSLYWCGLGILSSVGLGTGLHTFLLYLGPHIASVTLAAYECDSLDFPSPPYPDQIVCPDSSSTPLSRTAITVWSIMTKVRLEAFMWGAGTALGELPPYFVARAHRLAGQHEDDIDPQLAREISGTENGNTSGKSLTKRFKSKMIRLVTKVGFFGILSCASIPNPLFDLAGITCGYSLVPFWTFFGATLIGKAVIKMHIQKLFVIVAFNEDYVELFVEKSRNIPYVGEYLHEPLREFLVKQKKSLHRGSDAHVPRETSWLSFIFEWIVIAMISYFLISIINSMAQNYRKRIAKHKEESNCDHTRQNSVINHSKSVETLED